MDLTTFHAYCTAKPGVEETFPFDEQTLVFKVMGKMFALTGLERVPFQMNLKCDPNWAVELREQYPDILEGWHMSKKHWNTIIGEADIPAALYRKMIDHSYDLVVKGLSKKIRQELDGLS
jgi:predicted DNA-binding protein (MmcQ/YjbR family)